MTLLYWLLSFPFFTLLKPHVSDSLCVDTERLLKVMEGEALVWVQCKCVCDEFIVKSPFLEMLHVFLIPAPSSRQCTLSTEAKHCGSI